MARPEGLLLSKGKRKWRIGRQLGSGACGTVHDLTRKDDDDTSSYVVKLTPVPPVAANKKKKRSPAQVNADILYYENLVYNTHLVSLQGKLIPKLPRPGDPSAPPCYDDEHGYRYLVMEKMGGSLMDVVPALLQQFKSKKKIPFGPVATALVTCIQAIHEEKMLFVDVKPENFMLANSTSSNKLEKRIRMIDLGLVKSLKDVSGRHKENEEGAQLVGTPLYSSLNVHEGATLSRRDDLEAIAYVIAELLLVLLPQAVGANSKSRTHQEGALPWSSGTSDEDIFRIKQEQVQDPKSDFFLSLSIGGNDHIASCLWSYFNDIWELDFKKKPDYDSLKAHLAGLDVHVNAKASAKKATKRAPRPAAARVEVHLESESESEDSPIRATRSRASKRPSPRANGKPSKSRRVEEDDISEEEVEVMDISDVESEEESMDWVEVSDENHAPSNSVSASKRGVCLLVTDGPHSGESFALQAGSSDTIVLGSDPKSKSKDRFVLSKDTKIDGNHVKLVLNVTKKLCTVRVVDLKSSGTYVNGSKVVKGKERRAFINDTICIGDTTFRIQPLKAATKKDSPTPKSPTVTERSTKRASKKAPPPTKKAMPGGPGVRLVFTEGPHKGEIFALANDGAETVVFGSDPSAKSGETFSLDDEGADESHAKLELVACKKMASVQVTDLKSQHGTFVNNQQLPKGKGRRVFMNDTIQMGTSVMRVSPL